MNVHVTGDTCNIDTLSAILSRVPFDDNQSDSISSHTTDESTSVILATGRAHTSASSDQEDESFNSPEAPAFSEITSSSMCEDGVIVHKSHEMNEDVHVEESGCSRLLLGYKLVGDNIDKNVRPRHMRQDRQTLSMHYYHSYAVRDRVNVSGLSDARPSLKNTPLLSVPVTDVLPSDSDHKNLMHNFALLVSRHLVDHLHHFKEN